MSNRLRSAPSVLPRLFFLFGLPALLTSGKTETSAVVAVTKPEPEAESGTDVPAVVDPGTATQHTGVAVFRPRRINHSIFRTCIVFMYNFDICLELTKQGFS